MGYQIRYDPIRKLRGSEKQRTGPWALAGILFLIFLLMVNLFWAEGAEAIRELLLPGKEVAAVAALEEMSENFRQGTSFSDAVKKFSEAILDNEPISQH